MTESSEPAGADQAVPATMLPPSLAAAWGLRERPGKGPKPGLSLARIVAAGIKIATAEGIGAVSMARVASELGAGTMALYRYVSSKQELVTLMLDTAYGPPPPLPESARHWRAALSHWAWAQRAAMESALWAVLLPLTGPPATPNQVAWMEEGLECLRETRLDEGQKMSVILLISGYARNQTIMEAQLIEGVRSSGRTEQEAMADYGRIMGLLVDPQRFPELAKVIASGVMSKADDMAEEFEFGLERILDGIGALVDSLA
jgi:AcrR family transcriptional regulator